MKVLAGHTAGGVITSTTYAGGLRVTKPFLNYFYFMFWEGKGSKKKGLLVVFNYWEGGEDI